MKEYNKLYKIDSNGNTRVWWMESDGNKHRVHSGVLNGEIVTSEWTVTEGKNVGKKNQTTPEEQCSVEVAALYKKKLAQGNYKDSLDTESLESDNYIKPMLAKKYGEDYTPTESDYAKGIIWSQPKLDGTRNIALKTGLWSRQGKPIVSAPHIQEALTPLYEKYPGLILDGELYSDKLSQDFNTIISLVRKAKPEEADLEESKKAIQYHLYDVVAAPNQNLNSYASRYEFLHKLVNEELKHPSIVLVEATKVTSKEHLDELFQKCIEFGYEGQMIRLSTTNYENKRSKQLLKRKEFEEEEFEIVGIETGEGNRSGMAGKIFCKTKTGSTFGSGIRGDREFYRLLLQNKQDYIGTLASIRFQNYTPDGIPRFPVAVKFWGNKTREY
jgi:DNA ligase-1